MIKNNLLNPASFSILIIIALITNVSISSISSHSVIYLLLKICSSAVLLILLFIRLRSSNLPLSSPAILKSLQRILLLMTIIIIYLALTLFYSSNPVYGAYKIINIIISVIPNIIVMFYVITYLLTDQIEEYLISIIAIGFILTILSVLIIQPFDQSKIYVFAPARWSHVFVGRTVSFISLIVLLYSIKQKNNIKLLLYSFLFTLGLYITYLTGLRSALIGLVLCTLFTGGWLLYKKELDKSHLYSLILILTLSTILVYFTPQGITTPERIRNLISIENLDFAGDGPILSRIEAYKLSWQMFNDNILIGHGFGSFNGYNNIEWTRFLNYPHNIILEILSELGLIGLLIFGTLFFAVARRIVYAHHSSIITNITLIPAAYLFITLIFCLTLAMFSKDLSTQGFLWLFVVAFGVKGFRQSE